jgi:hypothetical protein
MLSAEGQEGDAWRGEVRKGVEPRVDLKVGRIEPRVDLKVGRIEPRVDLKVGRLLTSDASRELSRAIGSLHTADASCRRRRVPDILQALLPVPYILQAGRWAIDGRPLWRSLACTCA